MKRMLPLLLLVLVPATTALADGCPPAECGTTSTAVPGSPVILVRPSGTLGPVQGYDVATGAKRFSLPPGVLSADGRVFVSSSRAKANRTTVARYDGRTGRLASGWSVPGRWDIAGTASNGSRVALVRYRSHTTVIGIAARGLRSRSVLRGNFEVEALSHDGRHVYLIHWRDSGYTLEQLDLATRTLSPTKLDDPTEKMSGTAMTAVATRNGTWLLTLYLKGDGSSFLHALDLGSGLAHCVDLPLRGDFFTLGSTALVLSPDERQLYLASPVQGRVTTVDLAQLEITHTARFRAIPVRRVDMGVAPSAAVTANGRMLAFSGGDSLWLYDTAYGLVRRQIALGSTITGVGFRPDGRRVLAIRQRAAPVTLDAATGTR